MPSGSFCGFSLLKLHMLKVIKARALSSVEAALPTDWGIFGVGGRVGCVTQETAHKQTDILTPPQETAHKQTGILTPPQETAHKQTGILTPPQETANNQTDRRSDLRKRLRQVTRCKTHFTFQQDALPPNNSPPLQLGLLLFAFLPRQNCIQKQEDQIGASEKLCPGGNVAVFLSQPVKQPVSTETLYILSRNSSLRQQ